MLCEHANKEYIELEWEFFAFLSTYIYNMRSAMRNIITINDKIKGTICELSALLAKWYIATLCIYALSEHSDYLCTL